MQLPSLNIQKTDAYIGLHLQRPGLQIRQRNADLQILQDPVGMEMRTSKPKLSIDQTEAFADANLKTPLRLANDFWAKTESVVSQYVAKTALEGEQLKSIENGTGVIQRIAKQRSERPIPEINIGYMPRSMNRVRFDYRPSEVTIHAPFKEAEISVTRRAPQIEIPKWQTDVYVRQKNQISFEAVGVNVDRGL